MTIIQDYLSYTKKWKSKYGEKTIVLMQVGTFYEVYALMGENGEYIGSDILQFKNINDMVVSNKHITSPDENGIMREVHQAGFGISQKEKYTNRLQKHGYTSVIYNQDIQAKNTTRSVSEIISPGTFFSQDSVQITNHTMCIWINKYCHGKLSREGIIIGTSVLDVLTGRVTCNQYEKEYYHTPCTYDELEKLVSVYNPSECIIISNLSNTIVREIISFANINSKKLYTIDNDEEYQEEKCGEDEEENTFQDTQSQDTQSQDFKIFVKNAEKQTYQHETFSKFYPSILFTEIMEMFSTHWLSIQSLTFLLNFVHDHIPSLVNNLKPPEFDNISGKLILANHSLKQLNVIADDYKYSKLSSLSNFLNNCVTVMGKREFLRILHNPITNSDTLHKSYNITEYALQQNIWNNMRTKLKEITDIERFSRKLVVKTRDIVPKEISVFYKDVDNIKSLFTEMYTDATLQAFIHDDVYSKKQTNCKKHTDINTICQTIKDALDNTFNINCCSNVTLLNGDFLSSIKSPEDFFIKQGKSNEIDGFVNDFIHSRKKLEAIAKWLSDKIYEKEQSCKKTKSKAKISQKVNVKQQKKTEYVKIHDTAKSEPVLIATKIRIAYLKSYISNLSKEEKTVELKYVTDSGEMYKFIFCFDSLEYNSSGNNKTSMVITNKKIRELTFKTQSSESKLLNATILYFNRFIADVLLSYQNSIRVLVDFTTSIDILQCKCYIVHKYNYCKPVIDKNSEKSYFDINGVRHPLIEHLQTNEIYVTNNISLGCENKQKNSKKKYYDGMLLYGTNAVGKTSLIKSIGIAIIMAQSGLYVPCTSLKFVPYNAIYTRILGNDNMFKGLSTFEVEMTELRTILKMSDKNSLILGDELCSGTESDSALSIFTAGLEQLHNTGATHLFATHFHEIQQYDEIAALKRLCMKHMAVRYDESKKFLIYDRKLKDGAGDSMYGLEVCKSLHLPETFLKRAKYIRTKYNKSQENILQQSESRYNSKKIKGVCEKCGKKASDTHHLQHQQYASGVNDYIETNNETFHKNHKANLISVCKRCHDNFHKSGKQHKRVKTTAGYQVLEIT